MSKKKVLLYDQIKEDLNIFRKNRDQKSLDALRVVLGELQRNPNKDYSDESVMKQIKSIRKITLKNSKPDYLIVSIIDHYIPEPVATQEIRDWLSSNGYDKDKILSLPKPFILIGIVKKSFDGREVDGNVIKDVIEEILNDVDGFVEEIKNIDSYLDVMTRKNI